MDMFDEAAAMESALKLSGLTQSSLAKNMGVSQSYVANKLRLLSLSDEVKEQIRKGGISERHARAILRLHSRDSQMEIITKVIERHLTVRECEALVDSIADSIPKSVIGIKEKRDRIGAFIYSLKKSVGNLSSIGIDATIRQSYEKNKVYLTVILSDDF